MSSKFANQTQLSPNFVTTVATITAIGDSTETAIGKLQAQNFALGEGAYQGAQKAKLATGITWAGNRQEGSPRHSGIVSFAPY